MKTVCLLLIISSLEICRGQVPVDSSAVLWIGIKNLLTVDTDSIPNPWLTSADAAVTRKGKYFEIFVSDAVAGKRINVDVYNITGNDTTKKYTRNFFVKAVPNPSFMIGGQLIGDTISKQTILKDKKISVSLGDSLLDSKFPFYLSSFDMEIDGKSFPSNSNVVTPSMIHYIANTKGNKIRILNDRVTMSGETHFIVRDKTFILVR